MIDSPSGAGASSYRAMLSQAAAQKAAREQAQAQKPDLFPHKGAILLFFATILYFAWAKSRAEDACPPARRWGSPCTAERAWPYGDHTGPAVVYFVALACIALYDPWLRRLVEACSYKGPILALQRKYRTAAQTPEQFPHKGVILLFFATIWFFAWAKSRSGPTPEEPDAWPYGDHKRPAVVYFLALACIALYASTIRRRASVRYEIY